MADAITLSARCEDAVRAGHLRADVARTIDAMAKAAIEIEALIVLGALAGAMSEMVGTNSDGDTQKVLDVRTNDIVMAALKGAPVAEVASEESEEIVVLNRTATLAVAMDPLDGSSNIDANMSVGTIFSIVPFDATAKGPLGSFSASGDAQLAAGFVVYGPQTTLVLTFGQGVDIFTLDRRDGAFKRTKKNVRVAEGTREFAINASNYRHWDAPVRTYFDDCINGKDGIRDQNFNTRWHGAMVAEAFRIVQKGGIFLYPGDARPGYEQGRLRLLYEAAPVAFLMEQAGGMASTGRERILDIKATSIHQRVPLIFGAADKVKRLERMHDAPDGEADSAPLFAERGLFRTTS